MLLQLLAMLIAIATTVGCHQPRARFAEASGPTVPFTSTNRWTLAHEIVQQEVDDKNETAQHLATLDEVLREILLELNRLPPPKNERQQVKQFFSTVDAALVRQNFVYPPQGLVSLLSEALTPKRLSAADLELALRKDANWRREMRIRRAVRQRANVYISDCDTTALIYLAAAELAGYPCAMVEIPGHSFLRWSKTDVTLNWDPNLGAIYSDEKYAREAGLPTKTNDCLPYLKSMSREETLGYWMAIIGRERAKEERFAEAARAFEQACELVPKSLYAAHERAWFLATCPDPVYRNGRAAVPIVARVVECWPDPNHMDTLAIAHAEAGNFERAVEIERLAFARSKTWHRSRYAIDPWPAFPQLIAAFSRGETYADLAARAGGAEP